MTRADIQTADITSMDAMYKLKAHTLALHDDRDSWRRVAERLEREKVALHDKLDRARELLRTADIEFRKLPESHSKDEWLNDFLADIVEKAIDG